jgi:hypothetical protein
MSKKQDMVEVKKYIAAFKQWGGVPKNCGCIVSHWRYGTDVRELAALSRYGIVYPPPGH